MLVIKVENPFSVAPVQKGGELQTIKTEKGIHGWGLKSARAAAEKYDGMVKTSIEGNIFSVVATLSFTGVE
jgi:ribosomal protein L7/L12